MSQTSAAHAADIIIVAFLVIAALIGVVSGFTKLFLNLLAWASAVTLAMVFADQIQPFFFQFIPYTFPSTVIAASLIFVVTLSVLIYVSSSLGKLIKSSALSGLDRSLGLILGVCLGAFMVSGIFIVMPGLLSKEKYDNLVDNAKLGPLFQEASQYSRLIAGSLLSSKLLDSFMSTLDFPEPLSSGRQEVAPGALLNHQPTGYEGEDRNQIDQLLQEELESKREEPEALDSAKHTLKSTEDVVSKEYSVQSSSSQT
jgi:membrane protein required for colicin V production